MSSRRDICCTPPESHVRKEEGRAAPQLEPNVGGLRPARTPFWAPTGGADFGECLRTVEAISDDGSTDDWYREWTATADRVSGIADDCAARGHPTSAYEA